MKPRLPKLPPPEERRRIADKVAFFLLSLIMHIIALNYWNVLPAKGVAEGKSNGRHADKNGYSMQVKLIRTPSLGSNENMHEISAGILPAPQIDVPNGSDPASPNDAESVRKSLDPKPVWCSELDVKPERLLTPTKISEPEFGVNPGYIVLQVTILKNGSVEHVEIKDSTMRTDLREQAIKMVSDAQFKPGTRNGVPTDCRKEYIIAPSSN